MGRLGALLLLLGALGALADICSKYQTPPPRPPMPLSSWVLRRKDPLVRAPPSLAGETEVPMWDGVRGIGLPLWALTAVWAWPGLSWASAFRTWC